MPSVSKASGGCKEIERESLTRGAIIRQNNSCEVFVQEETKTFQLEAIGVVDSCFKDKFGTPRQPGLAPSSRAFLRMHKKFQPEQSLDGLAGFSHLWVVFWFHQNGNSRFHAKVHPPRMNGEQIGVFATRSPHRANPVGLSLVEIDSVEKEGVWVRGIDLIDGTPILDLKPYLPQVESIPEARAGWAGKAPIEISVEWLPEAMEELQNWSQKLERPELKSLVEETLRLDPRPVVYRGYEGETSPYRSRHAVRLYDGDIHFEFLSPNHLQVQKVLTDVHVKPT